MTAKAVSSGNGDWARAILGLLLTILFVWLLLEQADLVEIGNILSRLTFPAIVAALLSLALGYALRILRWALMLQSFEPTLRVRDCAWPFLVSIAANNLLPFRAGDALRVVAFRQQLKAPAMRLLGTVLLERLLDVSILLLLFFTLLGRAGGWAETGIVDVLAIVGIVGAVAVLVCLFFTGPLERLVRGLLGSPWFAQRSWASRAEEGLAHLFAALSLLRKPGLLAKLVMLTVLAWVFEGGVFVAVAWAVMPDLAGTPGPWFSMGSGTLATMLPSSPGYVGTFDYFAMAGLMAWGAAEEVAAGYAVAVHVLLWLPLTIAGGLYLLAPAGRMLRRRARG